MPEILTEEYVDGPEQHEDLEYVEVIDEIDGNPVLVEHWDFGNRQTSYLYFGEQEIIDQDYKFFQKLIQFETESIIFYIKGDKVQLDKQQIQKLYDIMEDNKEYIT